MQSPQSHGEDLDEDGTAADRIDVQGAQRDRHLRRDPLRPYGSGQGVYALCHCVRRGGGHQRHLPCAHGIQTSAIVVPNKFLRHKVWRAINTDELAEPNILGAVAPAAAFLESGDWLDECRQYIYENKQLARSFIRENVPGVRPIESDATYLLWMDCREVSEDSTKLFEFIRRETGLVLIDGSGYGKGGEGFLRMCLAYPRAQIEDGLARFAKGVAAYKASLAGSK